MKRQRAFRFGVIDESSLSQEEWVQKAQRVEQLGYNTFLIRDHFIQGDFKHQLAPIPALMAAADATKKLRVGSLVFANEEGVSSLVLERDGYDPSMNRQEFLSTHLEYASNACKKLFTFSKESLLRNRSPLQASTTLSLTLRVFPSPHKNRIHLCLLALVANACSPLQPEKLISLASCRKL